MPTLFVESPDGIRIAYERSGAGKALVLLHGGGNSRRMWHEAGYVERLQDTFTVISLDFRGHGGSSLPTDPADYMIEKMIVDVLAVVDECGCERFSIWGFSFGGRVGRYLAARSDRVTRIALMGTPLGNSYSAGFRKEIMDFCLHWPPILQAQAEGRLDLDSLSEKDRDFLGSFHVGAMLGWGPAMLAWPSVEPADFRCPVLWLVGSKDRVAMRSVRKYRPVLEGSSVQLEVVEGLDHGQIVGEIDRVFGTLLAFTQA